MKLGNEEFNILIISGLHQLMLMMIIINIRVNRMKVREDMIKHFITEEVCNFHIMSVVIVPFIFIHMMKIMSIFCS